MRIGTLGYRTPTGLGYQVKSYTEHLPVTKVLVIDLSGHNGMPLNEWHSEHPTVRGYPTNRDIDVFLEDLDVVLLAETPLNYYLYERAKEVGVKTAVVYNFEFFDHFLHPEYPTPDLLIAPSRWRYDEIDHFAKMRGIQHTYLHHPVDREVFKFRLRHSRKFIHIAGNPAVNDRNGTWDFMRVLPTGTVITQSDDLARHIRMRYSQSRVHSAISDPTRLYEMGDILVLPRRYGGNCLPLNEALSCGLPVIMPDISPNNQLLPPEWLVPATVEGAFTPRTVIDIYSTNLQALSDKLEWFRDQPIEPHSQKANEIAKSISWEVMKPQYLNVLERLCGS